MTYRIGGAATHVRKTSPKLLGLAGRASALLVVLLLCASTASAAGRKYGLFVGINEYTFEGGRLYGAVNDATNLRRVMIDSFNFEPGHSTLLTDAHATREAIIRNINEYASIVQAGDLFVFTFSGHGTVFPDAASEELDETRQIEMDVMLPGGRFVLPRGLYDSSLVPVNAGDEAGGRAWKNLILDDELYNLFSTFTRKGAHVVFISDSCHSGTVGKGAGTEQARVKFLSPLNVLKVSSLDQLRDAQLRGQRRVGARNMGRGSYLVLTGSRDDEFSLDVGRGTPDAAGLFTKTLLTVIQRNGARLTYSQLMARVQPEVRRQARAQDNEQTPQLDARFGNSGAVIFSPPAAVRNKNRKNRIP